MEAKALLRLAGIGAPPDTLAASPEAAVEAAQRIGYPVVLKAVCRELVHKSDIGAVKLALSSATAVLEAWRGIESALARHLPGSRFEGCSVQQMASGETEVIIGAHWDPQFGAVVLAGAGGVLVEIVRDVALALAPLTQARARAVLERLQVWPILTGARGRPLADVDALSDALVRLSWIAHLAGPRLVELEVNPLLVQTSGVIALDARGTVTSIDDRKA
jgi:acetyl-CoA synthetase (ADP-forming)